MRTPVLLLLAAKLLCGRTYDVASIKPAPDHGFNKKEGGVKLISANLNLEAASLWDLIAAAYGIQDYQLSGPDWMKSARFDVVAKAPGDPSLEEKRKMLQMLLADRFKLAVHRDVKELPMDTLVAGKGRPKLGEKKPEPGDRDRISMQDGRLFFQNFTMPQLAAFLSRGNPDGPLVDATGIEGRYDFAVDIDSASAEPGDVKRSMERTMQDGSMARMVAEQLGLKVERRKLATDIVVVDHVERLPVEN